MSRLLNNSLFNILIITERIFFPKFLPINQQILYGEESPHSQNIISLKKISKPLPKPVIQHLRSTWNMAKCAFKSIWVVSEAQSVFKFFEAKKLVILGNLKRTLLALYYLFCSPTNVILKTPQHSSHEMQWYCYFFNKGGNC